MIHPCPTRVKISNNQIALWGLQCVSVWAATTHSVVRKVPTADCPLPFQNAVGAVPDCHHQVCPSHSLQCRGSLPLSTGTLPSAEITSPLAPGTLSHAKETPP